MASTEEVAMPVGEVVMVKAEGEGDPDDPNKAQVILQLQPISTGDEAAETDAAIIAVEESAGQADRDDVEIGCPITCGDCKALLLMKKFVCPGINVKCVKYEDQLISPKQFVHMSGKATLKDWKRAIRMGGVMLRKMMDSGQLDFYQHSTLCTNTCRSTKFDLLINNTRFPPDGTGPATPTSSQAQAPQGSGGEDKSDALSGKLDWSSSESAARKDTGEISEDTLSFWKGIAEVGLLGEVVSNISSELRRMLDGVQQQQETATAALQDAEVAVLSNLAQVFGLLDAVKRTVERRKQQAEPSQEQLLSTLSSLEVQLEEQKQQQVRLAASCRSKAPSKRASKRPRLQRPASTTTLLSCPVSQQQFTVLSPISLSSVASPFSVAGLPVVSNAVTLLPAASQLFTRYMVAADGKADTFTLHPSPGLTLVGAASAAVQESSQLGALVSPLELVQLSQQPDMVPVDGAVLLQQEVMQAEMEAGQEHTLIEINPAPLEQGVGVMELRLDEEAGPQQAAGVDGARAEEVQGLQLDAGGQLDASGAPPPPLQLSTVQIVVLGDPPQEGSRAKEMQ